jgi:hypothetical protein
MDRNDTVLCGELAATLGAVFDLAVTASSPSTDLVEALRLRRAARSQLDFCRVLLRQLNRSRLAGAKIDQPAAAGTGLPGRPRPQRPTSFPGGDMRSDEPGFANPMPGTADVTHGDSYTQGSTGSTRPASAELGQAPVSADPFQSAQGPRPMTAQGYGSTSDGSDPFRDAISGVVTPPPVVAGAKVAGPHHPNAESGGGR